MRKRILSVILAVIVTFTSMDMSVFASEVNENAGEAIQAQAEETKAGNAGAGDNDINGLVKASSVSYERISRVSRDDGTWLFPLSKSYWNKFSDWAGCPGNSKCSFCGKIHNGWGDTAHTGQSYGHNGFDIGVPTGTSVLAAASGTVAYTSTGNNGGRGNFVVIEHPIGGIDFSYYSYYQHLSSISVNKGASIKAGDTIAKSGNSGIGTGAHLHFGIVIAKKGTNIGSRLSQIEGYGWVTGSGNKEGRILVNPSTKQQDMPTGNAEVIPPLAYHSGSVTYTFDKSKVTIGTVATGASQLKISGQTYPSTLTQGSSWTCKGTITSNYNITQVGGYIIQYDNGKEKTPQVYSVVQHPNTTSYSLENSAIDTGLLFNKLSPGTYYYKITAHDSSGKALTLIEHEFMIKGTSTLKISGEAYPPTLTQGTSWTCKGTITSNYRLTQIGCYINQYPNNEEKQIYTAVIHPEKTMTYSIDNSDVNNALQFNKLPVGTYYYTVTAHDASGQTSYMVYRKEFKVVEPESTLKISGATYPTSINQGSDFTCQGTISSNYNITVANFYIFQLVDGVQKDIYHKMVTPNVTSYSIDNSDIKNALLFKNLPAGGYYYRVTAEDSSGKWLNLVNRQFTVVAQCNFSGEITSPASGTVVNVPLVKIQAQASDSYGIKSFNIKLSGDAEQTITVDAVKSGSAYVCNYTMDLSVSGSYEVAVDALCDNGITHKVGSRTFIYEMKDNEPYISGLEDKIYTGREIRQDIKLYFNNSLLKEGVDYNLRYKNNVNVYTYAKNDYDDFEAGLKANGKRVKYNSFNPSKAPQVIIKMKGNYSGSHIVYYQIKPADISGGKVNADNMTVTYSGRKQTPTPVLTWNGRKLKYGTDFKIPKYDALKSDKSAFTQPGSYNLTIAGKKNFSGEIPVVLTISNDIKQIAITKATVKCTKSCVWTGEQIKPADFSVSYKKDVMSVENGDFVVSYGENKAVGTGSITLTGTGKDTDGDGYSYIGSKTISFKITGIPMDKVIVSGVNKSYTYTGIEIKPEAVLTYRANKNTGNVNLTKGVNYTVDYKKNKDKGTATIIFKGIESGGCTGVKKQTFKITASGISASEADETAFEQITITFKDSANVVDGVYTAPYMKDSVRPEIVVTSGNKTLEVGKDYTVKYSNNTNIALSTDVKAPTITVNGKGNYTGSRQIHFSIVTKSLTNENGIKVVANDKVVSTNKNGYRQSFKVYDADGSLLGANDYDTKNVVYTLIKAKNEDGTMAEVNKILDDDSYVEVDSVIRIIVTGKGNYQGGIATGTYRIIENNCDISKATIQINNQTYTGNAIEIT